MNSMPLVRIHAPNDIRIDEVDAPVPGPDDVVVRVVRCGICGSDLSYAKLGGIPGAASPFALGHEFAGVVEAAGNNVSCVQVGDRVVVHPMAGGNSIGASGIKGAFAPYLLYSDATGHPEGLLKLPDELDFDMGAMVEPLAVGMHAVNQGQITAGTKVAIFGAGPVGLAAAVSANYYGAEKVTVIDMSSKRLSIAAEMGFSVFKADSGDLKSFLIDQHGATSDPMLGEHPATDVFIEATGVGAVFQQICETARKGARVVVVAVHFAPVELNMINFLLRELVITASYEYPVEFPAALEMLVSGKVNVRPMITHHFPLSQFNEAFSQAQRQDESLKVLVDCQA